MRGDKKHQAVIVTGAASGIGKAIAENGRQMKCQQSLDSLKQIDERLRNT